MHMNKSNKSTIKPLKKRTLILVSGGNGSGNDPGAKTKAPEIEHYAGWRGYNKK
ncbi:hypothetical protein [Pseudoalteromonas sp. PS5]|uniref:hypothetical protein n=1 Tax=Pseudoalteromonas sp. PS5 TaxID=1437473 RepID=UPI00138711C6|nr:hypothetical protein [Pseudoalteromonas sp. PS5]